MAWAVYHDSTHSPLDIGKIVEDYPGVVTIRYSEGQTWSLEDWDPKYIRKFKKIESAINYLTKRDKYHSKRWWKEKIMERLPSEFSRSRSF